MTGDIVVAASPGAPEGRVKTVLARGRLIVATDAGGVRVPFKRLMWSRKRRAWRCFSREAIEGGEALTAPVFPSAILRPGDCIRLLNWPLTNSGFVLRVQHKMIKGQRLRYAIISTSCGPMTIIVNSPRLTYDQENCCWVVDYKGWEKVWLTAPPPVTAVVT